MDKASMDIMEHGYGQECPSRIDITCDVQEDGLKVVIYKNGDSFDPKTVPDPEINMSLVENKLHCLG